MYEKKFQLENQVQKNNSKKTLKVTFSFGDNLLFAKLQCRRKTFICLHFNLKFYIKISKFTKTTSSKFDLSLAKNTLFFDKVRRQESVRTKIFLGKTEKDYWCQ